MCDRNHSCVVHDSFICVRRLIHMCEKNHSSHIYVRRLIFAHVWQKSFVCGTRLNHMCEKTHSYVWEESFFSNMCEKTHFCACVTEIIRVWYTTHSYVWEDAFKMSLLTHMCAKSITKQKPRDLCDMSRLNLRHDSFACATRLLHTCDTPLYMCDMTLHMCDITPSCVRKPWPCRKAKSHVCRTAFSRLLKIIGLFCKRTL